MTKINSIKGILYTRGVWGLIKYLLPYSFLFIRGIFYGYPFVFIGKNVILKNKKHLKIAKFARIEDYVYIDAYSENGIDIGAYSKIGAYSRLIASGSPSQLGKGIKLGINVSFAEFCFVGGAGGVFIGDNSIFGSYVSIHPQNHNFDIDLPNPFASVTSKGITIGKNCWFGAKCMVLDENIIFDNVAFGGGSIITKGIYNSNCVYVGNPARLLKNFNS